MISSALSGSFTPGSWITILLDKSLVISGSETPRLSILSLILSIASSNFSEVTSSAPASVGLKIIWVPPLRSRPRFIGLANI
jgi:hypothetical protein